MDQPAQTMGYMIAGYTVIFVTLFGYIASLALRWRHLQEKKRLLESEEESADQTEAK